MYINLFLKSMWTVTTSRRDDGDMDVTASHDSGFSYSSLIHEGDFSEFTETAKKLLGEHLLKNQDLSAYKDKLEAILNNK